MSGPFNYIPFGDNPGQLYPLASQDTYVSFDAPLSVVGSGGSGPSAGVATVTGGTNIIASGEANVVINLNPVLTSMSSISFTGGNGGLVGLSTINGTPYVAGGGGAVPANLAVSTLAVSSIINFQGNTGVITNLSTVNGAPYVTGGSGAVPANLALSSLTISGADNNTTNDIILQGNGGLRVEAFPSMTWQNTNRLNVSAFSTISLDIQDVKSLILPPGAPDCTGEGEYCCPTFQLNGPNGPTNCPIAASAIVLGFQTTVVGAPSIYTDATAVSTLYMAASSTINMQTPTFVAPAAVTGISSMNGIYMDWAKISTLAGAAP